MKTIGISTSFMSSIFLFVAAGDQSQEPGSNAGWSPSKESLSLQHFPPKGSPETRSEFRRISRINIRITNITPISLVKDIIAGAGAEKTLIFVYIYI